MARTQSQFGRGDRIRQCHHVLKVWKCSFLCGALPGMGFIVIVLMIIFGTLAMYIWEGFT